MLGSTFVGLRCLEGHRLGRQQHLFSAWSKAHRNGSSKLTTQGVSARSAKCARFITKGQKDLQYAFCKPRTSLRVSRGSRLRTRPLQNRYLSAQWPVHADHLMSAPFFLAPIIAFLKSSIVLKATASLVTFVKTGILAKVFAPIVAFLKSGTVVKTISVISRVALSIVAPLRLQARRILRWWHGRDHIIQLRAARHAAGQTRPGTHFKRTTLILISAPVVLLSIALLASLERTPVWGRLRIIMLSTDEEACLVEDFLSPGTHPDASTHRDWLAILRAANGEDESPPGTLMGMPVLDPRVDWRARWVQNVFLQLEDGFARLNLTCEAEEAKETLVYDVPDGSRVTRLIVPPVDYPLTVRPALLRHQEHAEDESAKGPLITRYACIVVDSPICNAFSVGFGPVLKSAPDECEEAPGVVVVYTGLLDEILNSGARTSEPVRLNSHAPSSVFGVFQRASYSTPQPATTIVPSKYETDQLASTLAHELGHLLLSHSLETVSSNNMYELLITLGTDIIRTALYPLTAFLGPVFNDWFGAQVRVHAALGLHLSSSCASRAAEAEADRLALRILLGARVDPRVARDVWGAGGLFDRVARREAAQVHSGATNVGGNREETGGWLEKSGFTQSHPGNEERYRCIAEELEMWEALGRAKECEETEDGAGEIAEKVRADVNEDIGS